MAATAQSYKELVDRDRKTIWHPFTQAKTTRDAIPIVRGKGAYLYDADNNKYLDAISSWWVNLHGHAHPYIANKLKEQIDELEHVIFAGFTHAPAVELAASLLMHLPGQMSKIFYTDNGSTAVEAALKMAFQYRYNKNPKDRKNKVIALQNSYHGDTVGAMSAAGKNDFNKPFWKYLFDVDTIAAPFEGAQDAPLQHLKHKLEQGDVSCFIFEPLILGVGGMHIYPPNGLDKLLKLCRSYNVLTIADEVLTGFGRVGSLFACDQLQEKPDMICLSKGLTGGFLPLGAVACNESIFQAFYSDSLNHALLHGHTFAGNPLACSCGLASLDLLLTDSCAAQRTMIAKAHCQFVNNWKGHPKLKRCESIGTILAIEYQSGVTSYFAPLRDKLYHYFLDRKIILRPFGNVLHVIPPYCITEEDLSTIYSCISNTLENTW